MGWGTSCGAGPVGAGPALLSFLGIPGGISCGHSPRGIMGTLSFGQTPRILLDPQTPRHHGRKPLEYSRSREPSPTSKLKGLLLPPSGNQGKRLSRPSRTPRKSWRRRPPGLVRTFQRIVRTPSSRHCSQIPLDCNSKALWRHFLLAESWNVS